MKNEKISHYKTGGRGKDTPKYSKFQKPLTPK